MPQFNLDRFFKEEIVIDPESMNYSIYLWWTRHSKAYDPSYHENLCHYAWVVTLRSLGLWLFRVPVFPGTRGWLIWLLGDQIFGLCESIIRRRGFVVPLQHVGYVLVMMGIFYLFAKYRHYVADWVISPIERWVTRIVRQVGGKQVAILTITAVVLIIESFLAVKFGLKGILYSLWVVLSLAVECAIVCVGLLVICLVIRGFFLGFRWLFRMLGLIKVKPKAHNLPPVRKTTSSGKLVAIHLWAKKNKLCPDMVMPSTQQIDS